MDNKIAINIYLSTIESKKQTKQIRTETESWIYGEHIYGAWWEGVWGNG